MRIATSYALADGWYFECCSRDDTPEQAALCAYPDIGCIHQGYTIYKRTETTTGDTPTVIVTEAQARAEALARAVPFLTGELQRTIHIWEGAKAARAREQRAKEEQMREAARDKALAEKLLQEERDKAGVRK